MPSSPRLGRSVSCEADTRLVTTRSRSFAGIRISPSLSRDLKKTGSESGFVTVRYKRSGAGRLHNACEIGRKSTSRARVNLLSARPSQNARRSAA